MKVPWWVGRGSPKLLSPRAAALHHQIAMPSVLQLFEAEAECLSIVPLLMQATSAALTR